ncbi:MAG: ABC transporter permease [Myxococcales bacterium]|nr:ABC transporter permease [Polyangiaceae bacterium]MDW8248814.1 ABC transporter permease [Myxococcales bacterium]
MSGQLTTFVAEAIRMAVPYMACGLGAVLTERSGVVNIGLEGALGVSALCAAVGAIATGSGLVGLGAGVSGGAFYCLLHGVLVVRARVDAMVSGIALTMAAYGGGRVALRLLYGSASNSPKVPGLPGLESTSAVLRVVSEPALLVFGVAAGMLVLVLERTRLGLRLRASGDNEAAAEAAGVEVGATRLWASVLSGVACGLGGVHMVFDQRQYDAGMTGGRGFLALAAAILGRHRPGATLLACGGFAALEAAQIAWQDSLKLAPELVRLLPFVATMGLLMRGRSGMALARGRLWR